MKMIITVLALVSASTALAAQDCVKKVEKAAIAIEKVNQPGTKVVVFTDTKEMAAGGGEMKYEVTLQNETNSAAVITEVTTDNDCTINNVAVTGRE